MAHDPLRFLFEAKQTDKKSMSVKGEWLAKITREAMQQGVEPALHIEIKGFTDPQLETTWVAVPFSVFRRMQLIAEDVDDDERAESDEVQR